MNKFFFAIVLLLISLTTFIIIFFSKSKINVKPQELIENKSTVIDLVKKEAKLIPDINIAYLRSQKYDAVAPIIEEELADGSNYKRYIASYMSEGNKIYGLLTVPKPMPDEEPPSDGYSAVVFNHGYIPPKQYVTTEKYTAYVDALARNKFVVFKIDLRGNGNSEGTPSGSYFSSGYTIDAINALKSLQKLEYVNKDKIGMWGHSMAGNLVLRAMLVSDEIAAGVIWAGAVYSYEDFAKYRLNDQSYVRRPVEPREEQREQTEDEKKLAAKYQELRESNKDLDLNDEFWTGISLTKNINHLTSPLQLHHSKNDTVVNVGYSRDLEKVLINNEKDYSYFEYEGGGHNIESPYFETAIQRTVDFFKENLK